MTVQKRQPNLPGQPEKREEKSNGAQRSMHDLVDRQRPPLATGDGRDVGNWEAYRRWLSRVQLPDRRRIAMDPSLYTWKGYRSWAEKVRRDWTPDE